ncbi:MAG: serine/threonine-protein kinase [Gaiellaceae bacterium]
MALETIAGRYRLESRLGSGSMSEVWRAEDTELERTVAIKLLRPDADRLRFEREARAAASLAHPNINALWDYGVAGDRPYIVLEYLPGGSLEERLAGGHPLPDEETRRIAGDIAAGLAAAHAGGLVHRDLKPANVLFDAEGRAKIADFGIARMGEGGTLTEAGTLLGTAAYISPEQAAGQPATPASDVYSLGVILFRMLTGRLPFESPQPMDLVAMHLRNAPPAVSAYRPDAPVALERLTAAALAKDPRERPRDGAALAAELAGVEPAAATRVLRRPGPPRRRTPVLGLVLGALVLALAGAGAAVISLRSDGAAPAPSTRSVVPAPIRPTTQATTAPPAPAPTTAPPTTAATTTAATTTASAPTTRAATSTRAATTAAATTAAVPPPPPPTTAPVTTVDTTTLPPTDTTVTTTTPTTPTDTTVTVP